MLPEVLFSLAITGYASLRIEGAATPWRIATFCLLLAGGLAILYGLLLALSACSVWTVRQQKFYEVWFYVIQFARYPDEIYRSHPVGAGISFVLTYLLPVLLAVNVPARYGAMLLENWKPAACLFVAAAICLVASRAFFRFALRSYRGASS